MPVHRVTFKTCVSGPKVRRMIQGTYLVIPIRTVCGSVQIDTKQTLRVLCMQQCTSARELAKKFGADIIRHVAVHHMKSTIEAIQFQRNTGTEIQCALPDTKPEHVQSSAGFPCCLVFNALLEL